jgi:hypothetical protein
MKLVHDDGKVPSIFFPAGELSKGGTCEFATPTCLERCPSDVTPNALEKWVYNQFIDRRADELAQSIFMELLDRNKLFLQWFPWGDCPSEMTEKISWIIHQLDNNKVTQCGFTRNKKLWDKIKHTITMGLTVEDKDKVVDYACSGLVGWPDYETGKVHLYRYTTSEIVGSVKKKGKYLGGCGGVWHENHEYEESIWEDKPKHVFEASCDLCAKHKRGCFAEDVVNVVRKA